MIDGWSPTTSLVTTVPAAGHTTRQVPASVTTCLSGPLPPKGAEPAPDPRTGATERTIPVKRPAPSVRAPGRPASIPSRHSACRRAAAPSPTPHRATIASSERLSGRLGSLLALLLLLVAPVAASFAASADPGGIVAGERPGEQIIAAETDTRLAAGRTLSILVRRYGAPRPPRDRQAEAALRDELAAAGAGEHVDAGPTDRGGDADDGLGWVPYSGPFGPDQASLLLNRCVYGARFEEIESAAASGLDATLDGLLTTSLPPVPGAWVSEPIPDTDGWTQAQFDSLDALYDARREYIRYWWNERIAYGPADITESMTHFWHDHFATRADVVWVPQSAWLQTDLFRRHATGNFKTLVRQICTDPAMLIFLDGAWNEAGYTNENFARELLELFTMGEGSGYTQQDVEEVSRACTGWKTDGVNAFLVPWLHDETPKTILGQTGNWGMNDVVRILFEQPATSRYVVRKLYQWYVGQYPAESDLNLLSDLFRRSNFEIRPVLETILRSRHFYEPQFRGAIVRDGVDFYAGQIRRFHVTGYQPAVSLNEWQRYWTDWQMWDYGHMLFYPPNVAGWPGYRAWINTTTMPLRKLYAGMVLDADMYGNPLGFGIDVVAEAERFSNPNSADALVTDLARLCFAMPPSATLKARLLDALLAGASPNEWSMNRPDAADRLHNLFLFAMRTPDYQLK